MTEKYPLIFEYSLNIVLYFARLTRMLTCALEVSGVEGTFRSTSEVIMRVLRDNKDSLMAMLEAVREHTHSFQLEHMFSHLNTCLPHLNTCFTYLNTCFTYLQTLMLT